MSFRSINETLIISNEWKDENNLLRYHKTCTWKEVSDLNRNGRKVPIAKDELMASPRPMYLSSIILLEPAYVTSTQFNNAKEARKRRVVTDVRVDEWLEGQQGSLMKVDFASTLTDRFCC